MVSLPLGESNRGEIRAVLRCVGGYSGVLTMSRRAEMVEVNSSLHRLQYVFVPCH